MKSFNVIWQNFNAQKFMPYDVMPYLINEYWNCKDKPETFEQFKQFIDNKAKYRYWSRCEYETVLCGWPNKDIQKKWDIYDQIMMNLDLVTEILIENVNGNQH